MDLSDFVVVFDLDDTLISESEYRLSGIAAVESAISSLYGEPFEGRIHDALRAGVDDLWGWSCQQLGLPSEVKTSFLWIYRLHMPTISLAPGILSLLHTLMDSHVSLAVLTDGRSITQRLKLTAVGLSSIPLFASEDYQSSKPSLDRFIAIEQLWPNRNYVYVADNPVKDFLAPNSRGWLTLAADWINPRFYKIDSSSLDLPYQPRFWLSHPSQVTRMLLSFSA